MIQRNRHSIRKEINKLLAILTKLHTRAARNPIPSSTTDIASESIVAAITESGFTPQQALLVSQTVTKHLETTNSRITAFRAAPVFLLPFEFPSWPLLEWKENDRDVLMLFHFDGGGGCKPGAYSWIMHSGTQKAARKASIQWLNASVRWDVGQLVHLKLLFEVAQHFLNILEWPTSDSLVLYAHLTPRNHTQEEFVVCLCEMLIVQVETLGLDVTSISKQSERRGHAI